MIAFGRKPLDGNEMITFGRKPLDGNEMITFGGKPLDTTQRRRCKDLPCLQVIERNYLKEDWTRTF